MARETSQWEREELDKVVRFGVFLLVLLVVFLCVYGLRFSSQVTKHNDQLLFLRFSIPVYTHTFISVYYIQQSLM